MSSGIPKCSLTAFIKYEDTTCYKIQLVQSNRQLHNRVRPRFFDQIGHETMCAFSRNKHFFTKSCHRQTYQSYEQPPRTYQNLYFQSHFSVLKIGRIFPKKIFYEEYWTRRPTFIKKCF